MVELYIEDRKIDLTEDLEISFTYEQIDADKLSSIKNSFSKTVNIPGTPNNNITFGHIFRMDRYLSVNATTNIGEGYDPHKKTNWLITKNGAVVNRGYCTLDNIVVREERDITYQLTLYGGLGEFFYNLSYVTSEDTDGTVPAPPIGDVGKPKNLADLYWKWRPKTSLYTYGTEMTRDEENTQTIMKCSSEIVAHAYHALSPTYTYSGTTDIDKDVCFVPCYTGLYDDFDSKHILVSTFNQNYNEYGEEPFLSIDNRARLRMSFPDNYVEDGVTYSTLDSSFSSSGAYRYGLVTFPRDVDPWEAGDLRVNELPVAIRLSKLMNVISQPYNNGGYDVEWDEDIVNGYHWRYGWVMLGKLKQEKNEVEILEITPGLHDGQETEIAVDNSSGSSTTTLPATSYDLQTSSTTLEAGNYNLLINVYPRLKFKTAYSDYLVTHCGNIISGSYKITQSGFNYVYTTSVLVHKIYDGNTLIKSVADIFYFSTDKYQYYFAYNRSGVQLSDIKQVLNGMINLRFMQQGQFIDEYRYHDCQIESPTMTEDAYGMTEFDIQCASELVKLNFDISSSVSNLRIEQSQGVMWTKVSNVTAITAGLYGTDPLTFEINGYQGGTAANPIRLSVDSPYGFVLSNQLTLFGFYDAAHQQESNTSQLLFRMNVDAINAIVVGRDTGFNIINLDKKTLFANTQAPMKYLSGFCKLMNYRFICDNTTKKIQIKTLKNYYINETLDINERVDIGRDISIKNVTTKYKTINIGLETPETYPVSLFNRISEDKFNVRRYGTGFNYPLTDTSILNDLVYKNTIDWQQSSIYYNNNPQLPQPYNTQSVSWTLFNVDSTDVNNIKKIDIYTVGAESNAVNLTATVDSLPKIALFDKSNKPVDIDSSFIFLNGFVKNYDYTYFETEPTGSDFEQEHYAISPRVNFSNDTYAQYYLNQDRCYIYDFRYNDEFAYWGYYSLQQNGTASSWVLPMFSRDLYNYYDEYYKSWKNSEYKLASCNLVNQEGLDSQYNLINTKFIHQPYYNYRKTVIGTPTSYNNEYEVHFIPEDNENTERIFDRNWKDYMDDLYDRNTRDVTLYVDLSGFGDANTIMRKFYAWKSHLWIIKKIENYKINDVTRDKFTRVTFHKINKLDTWTHTV